jgi:hypothetical protein
MSDIDKQREHINRAIALARDGVSDRINELDDRVRTDYSPTKLVSDHAPKIVAGGVVLGLLVGFGLPKPLRRLIAIGIPLAFVAMKVRKSLGADASSTPIEAARDYPI